MRRVRERVVWMGGGRGGGRRVKEGENGNAVGGTEETMRE